MIAYQTMNTDPPTVCKHGSTFDEVEDNQLQYPFQLCPECFGEHTEVVRWLNSDRGVYRYTGYKCRIRKGIFDHQCERVNYICKDCGCEFYQWYRTGGKQSVEVDNNIARAIIGFILTALSLFMLITSLLAKDSTGWMALVVWVSCISLAFFGVITGVALEEIFR